MNNFKRFRNGIQLAPDLAADPVTAKKGEIYYNVLTNTPRICTNDAPVVWEDLKLTAGTTNNAVLIWNAIANAWQENPSILAESNSVHSPADIDLIIHAGDASVVNTDGKNLHLNAGVGNGTGNKGTITLDGIKVNVNAKEALDPAGIEADLYYNTIAKQFKYHDGAIWRPLASGVGFVKVTLCDPVSTVLPIGTSPIVDGVTVTDGMTVLFTNLISGANKVYKAANTLSSTTWTSEVIFEGSDLPIVGDAVIILQGTGFADQTGEFTGFVWNFSAAIRQFNGIDYFEQSAIYASTIINNASGNLFSINAFGSEYSVVDYSIKRGTAREVGSLYIVHDGTIATVTGSDGSLASTGVDITAVIVTGSLRLNYVSDNSGSIGTFKFSLKRWSDSVGGPSGIPSYSGAAPVAGSAAGANGEIQFSDGVNLTSSPNLKYSTTDNALQIGGLEQLGLVGPVLLNDNQPTSAIIFSFPPVWEFVEVAYSIDRGTNRRRGRLQIVNNGIVANIDDTYVEINPMNIIFAVSLTGNVNVEYISSPNGFTSNFRYAVLRWQ